MPEKQAENAASTRILADVHRLDPPEVAVPPVAPFGRVHQLPERLAGFLGDEVPSLRGILEQGAYTRHQEPAIELTLLGLGGDPRVGIDNEFKVAERGGADLRHTGSRRDGEIAASGTILYNPAPSEKWGSSSAGRAPRSQCGGRGFDPLLLHHFHGYIVPRLAPVAQWIERPPPKR